MNIVREFYTNMDKIDFDDKAKWEMISTKDPVRIQVYEYEGQEIIVLTTHRHTAKQMALSWYHHLFGQDNND